MEILIFTLGVFVGAIVTLAYICILAIRSTYKNRKGDNQECTNQKQP